MTNYRDNNVSLPYDILITQIITYYNVDLSINANVELHWLHYFNWKTLNKLNIIQVNDVRQHGRVKQDDEHNDQDLVISDDHIKAIAP